MAAEKRLRIAYLSSADPKDLRSWSGIHHSVFTTLENHCGQVSAIGPFVPKWEYFFGRVLSFLSSRIFKKRHDYTHSKRIAKAYGKYFNKKIQEGNYDLVFAVAASSELAHVQTTLPIFYLADATFANVKGYYPFYANLLASSEREGEEIQKLALEKCAHLFFPSEWAANSAINDYGIASDKITIAPLGANMKEVPSFSKRTRSTDDKHVRLLFIGVEWERKGGPCALEALKDLQQRGYSASLTIVGCTPEISATGVKVIPFINKNDPAQREEFIALFTNHDFLILPTKAECFGLVFCEASAMGLPSLASDTGGVRGAIREGINGHLLPTKASGKDYSDKIVEIISDPVRYEKLAASSRSLFERELNWDAWGTTVAAEIKANLNIL